MSLKKVGVLWKKANKDNKEFLSGKLDLGASGQSTIMVFENNKKEDNHPDYTISMIIDEPSKA